MKNTLKTPTIGSALLPLIMIPIVIIVDIILVFIGYKVDSAIYNPPADTASFMVPAFTVISMIIAAIISFIALIIVIVLVAIRVSKYNKAKNINRNGGISHRKRLFLCDGLPGSCNLYLP